MRVSVMQPYFLPYLGYYRLIASVDKFVLLDDVNYINRGWINRNRIYHHGAPAWITLPLQGASQNKLIFELELVAGEEWRTRMAKTVRHAYCKAPHFEFGFALFEELLQQAQGNLSCFLYKTIARICAALGIKSEILPSSRIFSKGELKGQERILDICKKLKATEYINAPGGQGLYESAVFLAQGIQLRFLPEPPAGLGLKTSSPNQAHLSILDTLMHNPTSSVSHSIPQYHA